ncbi:hypothetical protein P3T18_003954 [Paraburkholderia sp. GAS199]|uniref:hypothetical protein n=1 Tax=Paraburkholderia sp. GAS199 TaxID=3035126 RepID=UPI003D1DF620
MNAGMADRHRFPSGSVAGNSKDEAIAPARMRRRDFVRGVGGPRLVSRVAVLLGLAALFTLRVGDACAQDASMLDERVTEQSVSKTICRPGYADTVAPPLDQLMAHKDRLLAARGLDSEDGLALALDRRVPIVLGGSPDAPANLDLLPWAGHQGERRKARAAVMLKRCVCEGKLSLAQAQATIVGQWSAVYSGFGQTSCDVSRLDVAGGEREPAEHDGAP